MPTIEPVADEIAMSIQLTTEPLEELLEQGESLDFRLDEEKWQDLEVGDHIEFWEDFTGWQTKPSDISRRAIVQIVQIFRAPSFRELFTAIETELGNHNDTEELLAGFRQWWSEEKEVDTGVLAFHVVLVPHMTA